MFRASLSCTVLFTSRSISSRDGPARTSSCLTPYLSFSRRVARAVGALRRGLRRRRRRRRRRAHEQISRTAAFLVNLTSADKNIDALEDVRDVAGASSLDPKPFAFSAVFIFTEQVRRRSWCVGTGRGLRACCQTRGEPAVVGLSGSPPSGRTSEPRGLSRVRSPWKPLEAGSHRCRSSRGGSDADDTCNLPACSRCSYS